MLVCVIASLMGLVAVWFHDSGEYVLHAEVDRKFKKHVKEDQIVVMRLPSSDEMESWSKKFREMFR